MFLKDSTNVINLRYPIQPTISFTSGGSLYSSGGYRGRIFTSTGELVVGVGGSFIALIVDVGYSGLAGGPVTSSDGYTTTTVANRDGSGGGGG